MTLEKVEFWNNRVTFFYDLNVFEYELTLKGIKSLIGDLVDNGFEQCVSNLSYHKIWLPADSIEFVCD